MIPMTKVAATKEEWWELIRKDWNEWNSKAHEDDRMGIMDYVDNVGKIYGWKPTRDRYGDIDIERA